MVFGSSPQGSIYSILILATKERKTKTGLAAGLEAGLKAGPMTKRKPGKFSVTKAVKATARERVGQPKAARVVDTEPRTGRDRKHKPKLEEIIRLEE
jgi:hypothetical protein